jgi:hypothetical protein
MRPAGRFCGVRTEVPFNSSEVAAATEQPSRGLRTNLIESFLINAQALVRSRSRLVCKAPNDIDLAGEERVQGDPCGPGGPPYGESEHL